MRAEARRQLKQDRFSKTTLEVAEQTVHWSAEHKGKVIAGAIVLAVIIAAVVGGWYYIQQQDEKASIDFTKATQTLNTPIRPAGMPPQPDNPSFASETERATEAHKQFQAIADKFPHSHAADYARYFLGVTSASLSDNAAAERDLKEVAGYHNADLSSLARMALASLYRNTGRSKDAIEIYKQLMQKPTNTVGKPAAEIALAETYQAAGMTADAKKQYEQIQKDSPASEAANLASSKLQEMK
ncbi:MAG TPA: tetratricopeptide repeat protein [Candidatus Binataceae bacterium]|nr:tetratricopeptide repeat protein [Candidatus Binataceae bacterium]